MCFNQRGDISTLNWSSLKLVNKFTYLGSSVSSTETGINTRLGKGWTATDRLSVIWMSDLTDKIKRSFFLNSGRIETVIWMPQRFYSNYARMLRAILNKSGRRHPTKYGHQPPITKTIQVIRTRYVGHCWRSRDELRSDILLWAPSHGRAKAGQPARIYIQQLCADTGCSPEDQPGVMDDRRESGSSVLVVRHDDNDTYIYIYTSLHKSRTWHTNGAA